MTESKGHVDFLGGYEYFRDDRNLYRSLATQTIDGGGFRLGAEWLCTGTFADRFVNRMRQVALEGRHP